MIKRNTLGILAAGALWTSFTYAADKPQFDLQMNNEFISGQINDGTRIGQGAIAYQSEHNGFQVWSDVAGYGGRPNHYALAGKSGNGNTLRVRLEKEEWLPDNHGGKGIILHANEDRATFYIVIDGDQWVNADSYSIELKGAVLSP